MKNIDISTIEKMALDCKNINEDYTFSDFLVAHTGSYVSRDKWLDWFRYLWFGIPEKYLYQTYRQLLSDIHILKGRQWYTEFFRPDMLAKITRNNKHDTVDNPEVSSLADEDGYITVYLGECKRTLYNCHSWSLNKDQAIALGRIKALIFKSPDFYCVTGKVKLDDVITRVNIRGRDEIVVLQKNVSSKTKEFFNAEDIELMEGWTIWM